METPPPEHPNFCVIDVVNVPINTEAIHEPEEQWPPPPEVMVGEEMAAGENAQEKHMIPDSTAIDNQPKESTCVNLGNDQASSGPMNLSKEDQEVMMVMQSIDLVNATYTEMTSPQQQQPTQSERPPIVYTSDPYYENWEGHQPN